MLRNDSAMFMAAVSAGCAAVSVESRIVALPVAAVSIGYGLGSFNEIFCDLFGEDVACQLRAHQNGITYGLISLGVAAVVMTTTDAWKKETRWI